MKTVSRWAGIGGKHPWSFLEGEEEEGGGGEGGGCASYRSGLFCVSRTAAMGIPKFETGPQKSKRGIPVSYWLLVEDV
jgi:hypothetical protein